MKKDYELNQVNLGELFIPSFFYINKHLYNIDLVHWLLKIFFAQK